ncbi:Protoheme IX farnesyltransferase, mitochondrial [Fusarium keratoplasticum]|uniref:Protoheme IX farnesyltransferase, mitochondrial n=1 Tax=Fusarium keratoplasticum TaxID=1328300 RepID=A0ACC0QIX2_9HYPO|nr:Protoheme IX farnesyltransferase, mitochondrial [Fusarium keratoplasticum]KAI8657247.1 Protoheme IX farnesyltransferase, mitochondrial [Fusarium keratoplasticum]KAI8658222.1 Protoheme IX farnesyltransferase, mitochondrial [Fusarium keratoplasticum]
MRPPRCLVPAAELQSLLLKAPRTGPSRRWMSAAAAFPAPRMVASTSSKCAPFFLSNRLFDRSNCLDFVILRRANGIYSTSASASVTPDSTVSSTTSNASNSSQSEPELAPHRRRQAQRREKAATAAAARGETPLPPDASSLLTSHAASHPTDSLRRHISTFLSLSKPRLTMLVVLTAMATYALYPVPEMLSPSTTETPSLSPLTLLFLTTGTALCSASANTFNMLYEPKTDAKMTRTRNRPLVRGLISKRSAIIFGVLSGIIGTGALYVGVNPTVSGLGFANIVIYAGMYTPLKAVTAFNTWVGAVVGGIPPLMGWAAAAGETATKDGSWRELLFANDGSSIGGWVMAGLLFAWQFPHFMALSWPIREEYKNAGLRMLAWTNPARNGRVALRYSIVFIPLCISLCAAGVTEWSFAVTSLPINAWLVREAVRFWKYEGHKGSARGLFWASVWHLPGVMILALLHKKGMWSRVWRSIFGEEDGEWEEEELDEMVSMAVENTGSRLQAEKPTR